MLSIIMPVWSVTPELATLAYANLQAIRDVAYVPTEVIVVDNGSPHSLPLHNVSSATYWQTNKGIAPAWNEGRRLAHGDVLAFVTSTTHVEEGWDKPLYDAALAGHIAFPLTNGAKPYGLGISGWCWTISKANADRVGEFDETFVPAWYEDTDFFRRALDLGIQLMSVSASNVTRAAGRQVVTAAPWAARSDLLFMSNRLRYHWKHGGDPNVAPDFWQKPLPDYER
jgi:glycosyltransferase involved in cell wall biosynthesis